MIKKILLIISLIISFSFVSSSFISITQTSAVPVDPVTGNKGEEKDKGGGDGGGQTETSSCDTSFLGLVPWDCGLTITQEGATVDEDILKNNIWLIATNVLKDITIIAAYLVLGFVIYGGYLYTFSGGDPGKVSSGKRTLIHAFTGLAIVLLASVIMDTIRFALLGAGSDNNLIDCVNNECIKPVNAITNGIQWAIGIAGVVSVIFVVYGGISYATSAGDSGKAKKAKDIIVYALIGLVIVALAEIITAFVSNIINSAT